MQAFSDLDAYCRSSNVCICYEISVSVLKDCEHGLIMEGMDNFNICITLCQPIPLGKARIVGVYIHICVNLRSLLKSSSGEKTVDLYVDIVISKISVCKYNQ